jgi:hypothetical protein
VWFETGTAGGTRTHKTLLLRQVPIPIRLLRHIEIILRLKLFPQVAYYLHELL